MYIENIISEANQWMKCGDMHSKSENNIEAEKAYDKAFEIANPVFHLLTKNCTTNIQIKRAITKKETACQENTILEQKEKHKKIINICDYILYQYNLKETLTKKETKKIQTTLILKIIAQENIIKIIKNQITENKEILKTLFKGKENE